MLFDNSVNLSDLFDGGMMVRFYSVNSKILLASVIIITNKLLGVFVIQFYKIFRNVKSKLKSLKRNSCNR